MKNWTTSGSLIWIFGNFYDLKVNKYTKTYHTRKKLIGITFYWLGGSPPPNTYNFFDEKAQKSERVQSLTQDEAKTKGKKFFFEASTTYFGFVDVFIDVT